MSNTPEADRLAGLSDAELIDESSRQTAQNLSSFTRDNAKTVRLVYGLAIAALLAMAAAAAIVYKKLGDA